MRGRRSQPTKQTTNNQFDTKREYYILYQANNTADKFTSKKYTKIVQRRSKLTPNPTQTRQIQALVQQLIEKDKQIQQKDKDYQALLQQFQQKDQQLIEKEKQIQQKDQQIQQIQFLLERLVQKEEKKGQSFALIGDNEIEEFEEIASGSFGIVKRAKWNEYIVAIKKVKQKHGEINEESIKEFKREASLLTILNHPYVVHFWGVCVNVR